MAPKAAAAGADVEFQQDQQSNQDRGQGQAGIAEQRVGQTETPGGLELLLQGLGREPQQPRAEPGQLGVVVPEGAGLRGAAARPGDLVPAGRRVLARPPGHRVAEQHQRAAGGGGQVDRLPGGGRQGERRERLAGQMVGRAVVHRDGGFGGLKPSPPIYGRQAGREHGRVVGRHAPMVPCAPGAVRLR